MENNSSQRSSLQAGALILALVLLLAQPRRAKAEEFLDVKAMYYSEDDDRMTVFSPAFYYQRDLSPTFSLRIDGVYNVISGASPTAAPPTAEMRTVYVTNTIPPTVIPSQPGGGSAGGGDDDDDDEEDDDDELGGMTYPAASFHTVAAATPAPAPGPSLPPVVVPGSETVTTTNVPTGRTSIPKADVEDKRVALNIELIQKVGAHALSGKLAYSSEHDYKSYGVALSDGIDFNSRNTVLNVGAAYTHDIISIYQTGGEETKRTVDLMIGVNQLLDKLTRLTANFTYGSVRGFINDPYKVVELNGVLANESRPDEKTKQVAYLGIMRRIELLSAGIEASYRYHHDSFGVDGSTIALAWFQELGDDFVLRPIARFYQQDAADFYAVRFTGEPEHYSSDYRISAFRAFSYGVKLTWRPIERLSLDVSYERYEQKGTDSVTDERVYPQAEVYAAGGRWWF